LSITQSTKSSENILPSQTPKPTKLNRSKIELSSESTELIKSSKIPENKKTNTQRVNNIKEV
jgi:hypothetical protein